MVALPEFVDRLVQQYWRKLLRYCGVSVFNLLFGQSLLFFFHSIADWPGWIANVTAVMISAVPAYLLSRHWVWGQRGPNSFKSEVLPFWLMALLGLTLSTVAVAIVDSRYDGAWPVQMASVGAFFLVWILKFFVLDRFMWRHSHLTPVSAAATEPV
jgi:putative flippase GtrA